MPLRMRFWGRLLGRYRQAFPDNDPQYKGVDSRKLLSHVLGLILAEGYCIINIDATIIAQRPKMAPHIEQMRKNIAETLRIDLKQINVKATTEEGLGFTGAGLGIAASAVCLLEEKIKNIKTRKKVMMEKSNPLGNGDFQST